MLLYVLIGLGFFELSDGVLSLRFEAYLPTSKTEATEGKNCNTSISISQEKTESFSCLSTVAARIGFNQLPDSMEAQPALTAAWHRQVTAMSHRHCLHRDHYSPCFLKSTKPEHVFSHSDCALTRPQHQKSPCEPGLCKYGRTSMGIPCWHQKGKL